MTERTTALPAEELAALPVLRPAAGASAATILADAQAGRFVLQDFCPLADSIEWELGQHFWRRQGNQAFLGASPVPFVINNDGVLSRHAADVLFAALEAADRDGALEPDLFVLELGIGVGLFARFFLDALRDLCLQSGKDYYDRLTYVAGDRSDKMLLDACRHGLFSGHPGHVLLRNVDALQPDADLAHDPALAAAGPRPFRAVFLNYVLDCLPAADLKVEGGQVRQLCVRTCLARHLDLREHTDLDADDLARLAASADADERRKLMDLYGLFASEYDYRPVAAADLPLGDYAVEYGRTVGHFLHNHGALRSLERLLGLLHPEGLILVNDYGQTEVTRGDDFEHQRFAEATGVGVNFPLLKAYFDGGEGSTQARSASAGTVPLAAASGLSAGQGSGDPTQARSASEGHGPGAGASGLCDPGAGASGLSGSFAGGARCQWVEPGEDNGRIHSRLLCHAPTDGASRLQSAVERFRELFGKGEYERLQKPLDTARACWQAGRFEVALNAYHEALQRQPSNWLLMNEVALFLTFTMRNPAAGAAVARVALDLNPACSSELWNTLGDCLYEAGDLREARLAYGRALRINPGDVKGRYNLAWVDVRERDYKAALARIAEGLALDATGEFYERLVKKQAEVLGLLSQRHGQQYLLLANRVSRLPTPADVERRPAPGEGPPVKEGPKPPSDPPVQKA